MTLHIGVYKLLAALYDWNYTFSIRYCEHSFRQFCLCVLYECCLRQINAIKDLTHLHLS